LPAYRFLDIGSAWEVYACHIVTVVAALPACVCLTPDFCLPAIDSASGCLLGGLYKGARRSGFMAEHSIRTHAKAALAQRTCLERVGALCLLAGTWMTPIAACRFCRAHGLWATPQRAFSRFHPRLEQERLPCAWTPWMVAARVAEPPQLLLPPASVGLLLLPWVSCL